MGSVSFSSNSRQPHSIPHTMVTALLENAVDRENRFSTCCHSTA